MIYVLIAVILFSIIPIIISYKKDYKKIMYLILAFDFSFALATLAYFWVPSQEYDLSRYYDWMNNMKIFEGDILIDYMFFSRGEPLTMLYFYLVSLSNNYSVVPFFPTLIGYFIMFYIIIDYCQLKKYNNKMTIFLVLVFISLFKYIFLVSGIRSTLAMILCVLALYKEFIKNNNKWYIKVLYFVALGIHNGIIALIFIRVLINFKSILRMKVKTIVITLFIAIAISLIFLVIFSQQIDYLNMIKEKVFIYIKFETAITLQYFYRCIQLILQAYMLFLVWKNKIYDEIYNENMKKYYKFLQILIIMCLMAFVYYNIWIRYLDFILFMELPIIADLLASYKNKKNKECLLLLMMLVIFIVGGIRIQIPIFADMDFVLK